MDYRKMKINELMHLKYEATARGNMSASREIAEHIKYYKKRVVVIRGRKVPIGTKGIIFWLKRQNYAKYPDAWGLNSSTRIGIETDAGEKYFTALDNVALCDIEKCTYYRNIGECACNNDFDDYGDCVYSDGIASGKAICRYYNPYQIQ
jgi:hypothetical protein